MNICHSVTICIILLTLQKKDPAWILRLAKKLTISVDLVFAFFEFVRVVLMFWAVLLKINTTIHMW